MVENCFMPTGIVFQANHCRMLQPKYQTQDEFDFKYGAKYESYGLHIKKA